MANQVASFEYKFEKTSEHDVCNGEMLFVMTIACCKVVLILFQEKLFENENAVFFVDDIKIGREQILFPIFGTIRPGNFILLSSNRK